MTTPAVNINSVLKTDGMTYNYSPSTGKKYNVATFPNAVTSRIVVETRPASSNHPKVNGWREPGPWSHSSSRVIVGVPSYRSTILGPTWDPELGREVLTYLQYQDGGSQLDSRSFGLPAFPVYLENSAVTKALLKLKDQKVNFGVAFGERRETARLLEDVCGNIADTVRRFRRSRPKDWVRLLRTSARRGEGFDVPNAWLEVQYGWKPLMSDVAGACEALDDTARSRPLIVTCVGKSVEKISSLYRRDTNVSAYFGWLCTVEGSHLSRVRLDYRLDSALLATFSSLGLTNPAEIVWELLPYSFVVDWFLPIGDYLASWDAPFGWQFRGGSIARKTVVTVKSQGPAHDNLRGDGNRANLVSTNTNSWHEYSQRYSRALLTSSPTPRIPSFKDPISSGHVANAMSLIVNAFR